MKLAATRLVLIAVVLSTLCTLGVIAQGLPSTTPPAPSSSERIEPAASKKVTPMANYANWRVSAYEDDWTKKDSSVITHVRDEDGSLDDPTPDQKDRIIKANDKDSPVGRTVYSGDTVGVILVGIDAETVWYRRGVLARRGELFLWILAAAGLGALIGLITVWVRRVKK